MTQPERDGLRIALAFTAALVSAEAFEIELPFIAPLVAGALAAAPPKPAVMVVLPFLAAGFAAGAAFLGTWGLGLPLVLAAILFGLFTLLFAASARPKLAVVGLLGLIVFAVVTDVLARYPEESDDIIGWVFRNIMLAAISAALAARLLPAGARDAPPPPPALAAIPAPIPAAWAAGILLISVFIVYALHPTAAGPVLLSIILMLRAEAGEAGGAAEAARNRLIGAFAGGGLAVLAAGIVSLTPSLPVLAATTLVCVWPAAWRAATPGRWQGPASKAVNAMAILQGQDLSALYDDAAERYWIRLSGVLVGLGAGALGLYLVRLWRRRGKPQRVA